MFRSRIGRRSVDRNPHAPRAGDVPGVGLGEAVQALQRERANLTNQNSGRDRPSDNYENKTVRLSYNITVFHNKEESHLALNNPIFVNRDASLSTKNDVITAVGLPMLNYYLELSVRNRKKAPTQIPGMFKKQNGNSDLFYTYNVEDFIDKWSFLGSLSDPPELAKNYSEGGVITPALNPKIGVNAAGVIRLKQQFAEELHTGDQVFYVVKPVVSPYKCFFGWRGETVGPRTSSDTSFLQVFGFSDNETVIPYASTAPGHMHPPLLRDRDGIAKMIATKQHYSIIEYDPINGFNVRQAEDVDVPDLIVDKYTEGYVIPVGVVQTVDKEPVSSEKLLLSHRDVTKQNELPNVSVARSS